jgi:hypothetical protein
VRRRIFEKTREEKPFDGLRADFGQEFRLMAQRLSRSAKSCHREAIRVLCELLNSSVAFNTSHLLHFFVGHAHINKVLLDGSGWYRLPCSTFFSSRSTAQIEQKKGFSRKDFIGSQAVLEFLFFLSQKRSENRQN